jgi:hypothetical protein
MVPIPDFCLSTVVIPEARSAVRDPLLTLSELIRGSRPSASLQPG